MSAQTGAAASAATAEARAAAGKAIDVVRDPLGRYRDAIFFASGFAGLIYESIWTHYLKLFLGHAAYAQTLVLGIFMGGMAIGAAITARYTTRIGHPLRTYAVIEAAVGVLAVLFHPLFVALTNGFYGVAFANHFDGVSFLATKWGLASLLILPQSILLGATFPVFASAATRGAPTAEGRSIASLYFANSIGGSVGVLMSGFFLIPMIGLPGTVIAAGLVNFAIAGIVLWRVNAGLRRLARSAAASAPAAANVALPKPAAAKTVAARSSAHSSSRHKAARKRGESQSSAAHGGTTKIAPAAPDLGTFAPRFFREANERFGAIEKLLIAVSLLTGASSFIYEIGWIRMLSLVLGSATHSFELMLSCFILGLALGGLWIRSRIDRAANAGVFLGYVQIVMAIAALATVPLHNATFDLVAWVVTQTPKTDAGYAIFNLVRYGVAALIMLPAAFCAGMTLPLATHLLYSRKGQGERAIGMIYSANTVGAIVGLILAVHVALPLFGLDYLVASGAMIDALLGVLLLVVFGARKEIVRALAALVACIAGTAAGAMTFNPQKIASGVFRTGQAGAKGTVLEIAHGKTATISVERTSEFVTIKTNGKPDASANPNTQGSYAFDEVTMTLAGAIPLLLHPSPRRIANIGFGSGLTGETVLADARVDRLDTIEIEPRMVDLARHFQRLNRNVYTDPRSAVHIDDAKAFFATNGKTYDVIVSEPSNPWVSGVAGLFSVEFYRHVTKYLNRDGLFAQWLQTYETHPDRVGSVLKAMEQAFDDYMVVALDYGDILLIGKAHGKLSVPENAYAALSPALKRTLRDIEVANQADIVFRIAGNKALFAPWLVSRNVPVNSDFFPYLDTHADRDRFLSRQWPDLYSLALSTYPISELMGGRPRLPDPSMITINGHFGPEPPALAARQVYEALHARPPNGEYFPVPIMPQNLAHQGRDIVNMCLDPPAGDTPFPLTKIANRVLPYLSPAEGRRLLLTLEQAACMNTLASTQAKWRTLLPAIADRDIKGIADAATELLDGGQGVTEIRTRYLLGMAMLGNVASDNATGALSLWSKYGGKAFIDKPPDFAFELLLAHLRR